MLLTRNLLPLVLVLAIFSTALAQPQNGKPAPPYPIQWSKRLPFAPEAAMVTDERLSLGRLADGNFEIAAAALGEEGLEPIIPAADDAAESPLWSSSSHELEAFVPGASRLFASSDKWIIIDENQQRISVLASEDVLASDTLNARETALPFKSINRVAVQGDTVYVFGGEGDGPMLAAKPLASFSSDEPWTLSLPLPEPREEAGLVVTDTNAFVFGGIVKLNDKTYAPRHNFALIPSTGEMSSWQQTPHYFSSEPGAAHAVELNDVLLVFPKVSEAVVEPASQTMHFSYSRKGILSPWREYKLNIPLQENPLLASDSNGGRLLVIGSDDQGVPRAWVIQLRKSTGPEKPRELDPTKHPRAHKFLGYSEALEKALENRQHHVVFLLGDDPDSKKLRDEVNTNRDFYAMLDGLVLSEPTPEQRDDLAKQFEVSILPSMALLDQDAYLIKVHEGAPSRIELKEFLEVLWQ